MKHLVTGGSGFLGNLIARRLFEQGESVTVLDIWEDPTRPKEIAFVNCDICDRAGVARAMAGIDIVHHNVALVPLTKSGSKFWDVNVQGTRVAAEEAARAGVKAFIHMSSSAIFCAVKELPVTNQTPASPREEYGRAKWEGELVVREVCEKGGISLIVIRPRTIIGQGRLGIFQILFEWIREGRNVYMIGDGSCPFQFIHAMDLMDAYMLLLRLGKPGVYNVGTDRYTTLRQGLEGLVKHAGTKSKVRGLPSWPSITALRILDLLGVSPLAPYHYLSYGKMISFDVEPLLKLGWAPKYSNEEMLRESYDWFCVHANDKVPSEQASAHRKPVKQGLLKLLKAIS
jgi:nucleoside-diphosphate-sugar epimerase